MAALLLLMSKTLIAIDNLALILLLLGAGVGTGAVVAPIASVDSIMHVFPVPF